MNISYQGRNEVVFAASKHMEEWIKNGDNLHFLSQNGSLCKIEELLIAESDPSFSTPLLYGEWRVTVEQNKVCLLGVGEKAILCAIEHFQNLLEKESVSLPYSYFHKKTYPVKRITLSGKSIESYRVVYQNSENPTKEQSHEDFYRTSAQKQAAQDFCHHIAASCGSEPELFHYESGLDLTDAIVIGPIDTRPTKIQAYGNCRVQVEGATMFVCAEDICGLEMGISHLCRMLTKNEENDISFSDLSFSGSLQERCEYETDSAAFVPCYHDRYQLSEHSLCFETKSEKLKHPDHAPFILAHRGEHTYYPENSLEANISAWRAGADATEVDLHRTRDGVLILMHDKTLTRTTNVLEKKGKNGLPDSVFPEDWSLEELRKLRLIDSYGALTPFLIPTLEEILIACNDKIFVHLDKKFDYRLEIFPLMRKNNTYRCLYLCNYIDWEGILEIRDDFADRGIVLPSIYRIKLTRLNEMASELEKVAAANQTFTSNVVLLNDYYKYLPSHKKLAKQYRNQLRIASWMMWGTDSAYFWNEARQVGFNLLMTNFPLRMHTFFMDGSA